MALNLITKGYISKWIITRGYQGALSFIVREISMIYNFIKLSSNYIFKNKTISFIIKHYGKYN